MFSNLQSISCRDICQALVGFIFLLPPLSIAQVEPIYPPSEAAVLSYNLEQYSINQCDTLVISYVFTNVSNSQVQGLYFSDNWPNETNLISQSLTLLGEPVAAEHYVQAADPALGQYVCGYWVVQPAGQSAPQINPGDQITLTLELAGFAPGNNTLPLHTAVFIGDGVAHFSFGNPILFEVTEIPDTDGDCIENDGDNCPSVFNPEQADADDDQIGDLCDECTDSDHDNFGDPGFPNNTCPDDNCPYAFNPSQQDTNGDGVGDACGCCKGALRGNIDYSDPDTDSGVNGIDISDLVYLVDFMFTGGSSPVCFAEANNDGSGPGSDGIPDSTDDIDISDLVYLIDYMFTGGPPPTDCPLVRLQF